MTWANPPRSSVPLTVVALAALNVLAAPPINVLPVLIVVAPV
jgi:hypothetical protein